MAYRMTPARRAALRKAQQASARKRRKSGRKAMNRATGARARSAGKQLTTRANYGPGRNPVLKKVAKRRAINKADRKSHKAAVAKWKAHPHVAQHRKHVLRGAAVGTLIGGAGLGTGVGALVGSSMANAKRKGKKLPARPKRKRRR